MSADLWLEIDTGGDDPARLTDSINVTYNLTPMLRAAGYPGHREMVGAPAVEAGGVFASVAQKLRDGDYSEHLPANGWGTKKWAIKFCDELAEACAAHPKAKIGAWL